jgi:hypothetical protein
MRLYSILFQCSFAPLAGFRTRWRKSARRHAREGTHDTTGSSPRPSALQHVMTCHGQICPELSASVGLRPARAIHRIQKWRSLAGSWGVVFHMADTALHPTVYRAPQVSASLSQLRGVGSGALSPLRAQRTARRTRADTGGGCVPAGITPDSAPRRRRKRAGPAARLRPPRQRSTRWHLLGSQPR